MSGLRIKKYRTENCYSQKQFASIVGVSTRTIVRWEQNETKPNPEEAERIAAIIGVTAEDLLSDTDNGEENITTDEKITVLDRISENVNNLVTGQETINESLSSNRDIYIQRQDELISELKSQNEDLLSRIQTYEKALDNGKAEERHRKIRTMVIIATCITIVGLLFVAWIYWINYGLNGVVLDGPIEMGTPSYSEVDDGK